MLSILLICIGGFFLLHEYQCTMCVVPEARRTCKILLDWYCRQLLAAMNVMEMEPRSSGRSVRAHIRWVISPVLYHHLKSTENGRKSSSVPSTLWDLLCYPGLMHKWKTVAFGFFSLLFGQGVGHSIKQMLSWKLCALDLCMTLMKLIFHHLSTPMKIKF